MCYKAETVLSNKSYLVRHDKFLQVEHLDQTSTANSNKFNKAV